MDSYFYYRDNELYAEDLPVREIASALGTPFYLYSYSSIISRFKTFDQAFSPLPHLICFALKANSNISIIKTLLNQGAGIDIVSGGELYRALQAGADPQKIVYAGVGKTAAEIRYALEQNILMFNVESEAELFALEELAKLSGRKARIALRVNPDLDPQTHPYISTGLRENKFGLEIEKALTQYERAEKSDYLEITGIHQHIGSQITQLEPFITALEKIISLVNKLKERNILIKYINLGGGLGITYQDETPPRPQELADALIPRLKNTHSTILFEPGRFLVASAGILVSKVIYLKQNEKKKFVIIDAGMNDLLRPSLYKAYQKIIPLKKEPGRGCELVDVVGPICESGDFLAQNRILPELKKGELIAVRDAGAYGFSMSSHYNSRLKAAEVMVKGNKFSVIRKRESYRDLVRGEKTADFLSSDNAE